MSTRTSTIMSVNIIAGPIRATSQPRHEVLGQQVKMGDDLYLNVTPEIAQQWIGVLETIAEEGK